MCKMIGQLLRMMSDVIVSLRAISPVVSLFHQETISMQNEWEYYFFLFFFFFCFEKFFPIFAFILLVLFFLAFHHQ